MIELRDVERRLPNRKLFTKLNFIVQKGQSICIVGPSGIGKTTLLKIMAGLEPPDRGEVWVDGVLASKPEIHMHPADRNMGVVFQFPALWPHMTVADNVSYGLGNNPKSDRISRAQKLMSDLRIDDLKDKKPLALSGGEAKRVALARALIQEKHYMLLDEPLTHLDQKLKEHVLEVILKYTKEKEQTLVFVSHDEVIAGALGFPTYEMMEFGILREKE